MKAKIEQNATCSRHPLSKLHKPAIYLRPTAENPIAHPPFQIYAEMVADTNLKKRSKVVGALSTLESLQAELVTVNHALLTAVGAEYAMLAHWALALRDRIAAMAKR